MRRRPQILSLIASMSLSAPVGLWATEALADTAVADGALGRISDPFEGFNRGTYGLNKSLDRAVVRPAAIAYRRVLPKPAREGVHNVLTNLGAPVIFLNDVLQVEPGSASETVVRFGVNTTVGVLGVFDVASQMGVYAHRADFGQTLGHYGVATGPYIFLPIFGPSSLRDTVGLAVNLAANPFNYARFDGDVATKATVVIGGALDTRGELDKDLRDLDHSATDPYVTTRTIWVQNRSAFIRGDKPVDVTALPDFTADPPPKAK